MNDEKFTDVRASFWERLGFARVIVSLTGHGKAFVFNSECKCKTTGEF